MKTMFLTTILGPDSPGIIKSLAHTTRNLGGEWLTSKVIKLDDQFAAIMRVAIESSNEEKLKEELGNTFPQLQFVFVLKRPPSFKKNYQPFCCYCIVTQ